MRNFITQFFKRISPEHCCIKYVKKEKNKNKNFSLAKTKNLRDICKLSGWTYMRIVRKNYKIYFFDLNIKRWKNSINLSENVLEIYGRLNSIHLTYSIQFENVGSFFIIMPVNYAQNTVFLTFMSASVHVREGV